MGRERERKIESKSKRERERKREEFFRTLVNSTAALPIELSMIMEMFYVCTARWDSH